MVPWEVDLMGKALSSVIVRWIEGLNYFDKQVRADSGVSGGERSI